jgi:hypothetical protein
VRYDVAHQGYKEADVARPTSFRLPEELLARLEEEGRDSGTSITALVATLLDEGLKTRRFPGIVYRDGPTGRRAGLVGGPDIWEIVRDLKHTPGKGDKRIRRLADEVGVSSEQVRLAADFYGDHPDEIDRAIAETDRAATAVRQLVDRREQLLSS